MAWTAIPAKVNGVNAISAAEMNAYIADNLDHLRTLPCAKRVADYQSQTTGTVQEQEMVSGTGAYDEWDTDSINDASLNRYDLYGVDSVASNWYIGGDLNWTQNTAGDRRIEIYMQTGGVQVATKRYAANEQKRERMAAGGAFPTTSGERYFVVRAHQTSGSTLNFGGKAWCLQHGASAADTNDVENLSLTDATGITAWWNQWKDNATTLYRKPFARVRRATAQTIPDDSFTEIIWDTVVTDNHGFVVGGDESELIAPVGGWYYCQASAAIAAFTGSADRLLLAFYVNNSQFSPTMATSVFEMTSGTTHNNIEQIIRLESGDALTVKAYQSTGGTADLTGGTGMGMSCALLAGDVTAADRQYFPDGLPATPDFTTTSSDYLPRGLANLATRDMFAYLWDPPVLGLKHRTVDGGAITLDGDGSWTSISMDVNLFDNYSILDDHKADGGIVLPHDGVWLVVAGIVVNPSDATGAIGDRGMRIRQNGRIHAPIRNSSATFSNWPWGQTSSTLINGTKGDVIRLEGLAVSTADTLTDPEVANAFLQVAWVRDKV